MISPTLKFIASHFLRTVGNNKETKESLLLDKQASIPVSVPVSLFTVLFELNYMDHIDLYKFMHLLCKKPGYSLHYT